MYDKVLITAEKIIIFTHFKGGSSLFFFFISLKVISFNLEFIKLLNSEFFSKE